jgi:hypothetical protein
LDALSEENKVLRETLAGSTSTNRHLVPKESLNVLEIERERLLSQLDEKEKRMARLKEASLCTNYLI